MVYKMDFKIAKQPKNPKQKDSSGKSPLNDAEPYFDGKLIPSTPDPSP